MRVVVVGATGNVGTSVLDALVDEPLVECVVGIARRRPSLDVAKVEWRTADVAGDDLIRLFRGADVVVHLAWLIQPSHDQATVRRTNVVGTVRVCEAVAAARVPALVCASSIGAYSPGPKDAPVGESWPTHGVATSWYSRQKAYVERVLDTFELANPDVRVVRLRPALIFKREVGAEIRRLFTGRLLPGFLVRPGRVPLVPDIRGLRVQALHSADAGQAYRLAVVSDARGAFNLAADPPLDGATVAAALDARAVPVRPGLVRAAAAVSWHLRLQPTSPDWVDLALQVPLLDCTRARRELGWVPTRTATESLRELLDGIADRAGIDTPPLLPGRDVVAPPSGFTARVSRRYAASRRPP